jgi:MarR family transcriptional regulator, organic hydroperoxide resistance regulator
MSSAVPRYSPKKSLNLCATFFSRAFQKRLNQDLAHNGHKITAEHLTVLVHVWEQNGLSQWALAQKLFKDKTTMAHLVAGLESQKLIIRRKGHVDGREKILFITNRGQVVMDEVIVLVQKIVKQMLRGITRRDLETCRQVLRKAHNNLIE